MTATAAADAPLAEAAAINIIEQERGIAKIYLSSPLSV